MKSIVIVDVGGYATLVKVEQDPVVGNDLTIPPGGSLEGNVIDGRLESTGGPGSPNKMIVHLTGDLGMRNIFGGNFPTYRYARPS